MLKSYLKIAWKVLLRRKFFTFISLFGISFTLLVLMLVTAVMDHLFAPHAVDPRSGRSLYVTSMVLSGPRVSRGSGAGYGFLDRWIRTLPDVERVAVAQMPNRIPVYHEGRKIVAFLKRTDAAFWQVMDYEFVEGGPFGEEDDRNGNRVVVINETTRRRFFGEGTALGRTIPLEGSSFRVVGVVRDVPMVRLMAFSEIWAPIGTIKGAAYRRELVGDFVGIIVAKDRADFPAIKAEVAARLGRVEFPDRQFDTLQGGADTLFESWARAMFGRESGGGTAEWLRGLILLGMLLFMLLPTLNLININLSRILERAPEIGVRKAFGASSGTLVGQFITENVILTLVGGILGLALSWVALTAISASGVIPYAELGLNLRIFLYGLLLATVFGVLSGAYPAWRMSRLHPAQALSGRTA